MRPGKLNHLRNLFIKSFVPVLLVISCGKDDRPEKDIVAHVGIYSISATSFKRAYLPVILYGDQFDSPETREEILQYLIGQKILAQQGYKAGIDTIAQIQRAKHVTERKAIARQLYDRWVRQKLVQPTESDLREGFKRSQKALLVRHLFAKTEEEILGYYQKLMNGETDFHTLAREVFSDTVLSQNGGLLGWISFGDLDEALEDTVYALPVSRPSRPVKSQFGWHILQVDDYEQNLFLSEEDFSRDRSIIERKIVQRREELLGREVLNEFMKQHEITFNREITQRVFPILAANIQQTNDINNELVSDSDRSEFAELVEDLSDLEEETLVSVDGRAWTVGQVLDRLPEMNRRDLYGNLYVAVSNMIRDDLLVREGRNQGLHTHPDVLEEIQDNQDDLVARYFSATVADTIHFTESMIHNYYNKRQLSRYHAPDSLLINALYFRDSTQAIATMNRIRNGERLEIFLTSHPSGDHYFKDEWFTPSGPDTKLYDVAKRVATGAVIGPQHIEKQWVIFEVINRHRSPMKYETIKAKVARDMEKERYSATREILLNRYRPSYEISINNELLSQL